MPNPAILKPKRGTSSALAQEPIEDGALLTPTDANSIMLDQGNTRKTIKSGHTIENNAGTNLTQRDTMQFAGKALKATDDSSNEKTLINADPVEIDYEDWLELTEEQRENGYYLLQNYPYTPTRNSVSVTADGVKTMSTLLHDLYFAADRNKITKNAVLIMTNADGTERTVHKLISISTYAISFAYTYAPTTAFSATDTLVMASSTSNCLYIGVKEAASGNTITDYSSTIYTSGITFTLFYDIEVNPVAESTGMIFYKDFNIGGMTTGNYNVSFGTGVSTDAYRITSVGFKGTHDNNIVLSFSAETNGIRITSIRDAVYTVTNGTYIRVYFSKTNQLVAL